MNEVQWLIYAIIWDQTANNLITGNTQSNSQGVSRERVLNCPALSCWLHFIWCIFNTAAFASFLTDEVIKNGKPQKMRFKDGFGFSIFFAFNRKLLSAAING